VVRINDNSCIRYEWAKVRAWRRHSADADQALPDEVKESTTRGEESCRMRSVRGGGGILMHRRTLWLPYREAAWRCLPIRVQVDIFTFNSLVEGSEW